MTSTESKLLSGIALVGLALGVSGCSSGAGGGLLGSDDSFDPSSATSLQQAIDDASPGGTLSILPGTVSGQAIVDKPLRITGSGSATVLATPGTPMAFPDDSDDSSAVLIIRNTSGVVIENMVLSGPQDGIQIRNSSDVTVTNVEARGNGDDGLDIRGSTGITVSGSFGNNGDRGIQVREGSSGVTIQGCILDGNVDDGLRARESSAVSVAGCMADGNGGDGIEIRETTGASVTGSTLQGNAEYGLRLRESPGAVQSGNTFAGNVEGDLKVE